MTAPHVTAPGSWLLPALLSQRCCLSSRCWGSSWMKVGKDRSGFSHWSMKEQGLGRWKVGVRKWPSPGPSGAKSPGSWSSPRRLGEQTALLHGMAPGSWRGNSLGWIFRQEVHLPLWLCSTADLCWKFTCKLRTSTQPLSQKLREPGSGAGLWWQVLIGGQGV